MNRHPLSRKTPTATFSRANPSGKRRTGLRGTGLREPAAGNVERWQSPLQKSGSVTISGDRVGFLTDAEGPARSVFEVDPGDVVRARVVVSTSGNISTRLMITPSTGSGGPQYDQGTLTQWAQGKGVPLQAELTIPEGMKWASVALDQPNWTQGQMPEGTDQQPFPQAQMTGTISWTGAKITVNRPLGPADQGEPILGGFSTTDALVAGSALLGATVLFVSIN